jgi:hypothetical protein
MTERVKIGFEKDSRWREDWWRTRLRSLVDMLRRATNEVDPNPADALSWFQSDFDIHPGFVLYLVSAQYCVEIAHAVQAVGFVGERHDGRFGICEYPIDGVSVLTFERRYTNSRTVL